MQDYILKFIVDHALQIVIGGALVAVGVWVRGVIVQQRKNTLNEVHLEGERLSLQMQSTDINDLVADSNKEHGARPADNPAGQVVPPAGNGSKKG